MTATLNVVKEDEVSVNPLLGMYRYKMYSLQILAEIYKNMIS